MFVISQKFSCCRFPVHEDKEPAGGDAIHDPACSRWRIAPRIPSFCVRSFSVVSVREGHPARLTCTLVPRRL